MDPDERAREGVFMAFQYPVEIAGVNNAYFLKAALNAKRKHHGQPELDAIEFMQLIREKAKLLDIDESPAQPRGQRGLLGRREEAQRDLPDGAARAEARDPRRDRLGPRHRRAEDRRRRRQRAALARAVDHRRHALPAAARLHRAGLRARAERRKDRQVGRQGAGAGARGEGLRLDRDRRRAGRAGRTSMSWQEKLPGGAGRRASEAHDTRSRGVRRPRGLAGARLWTLRRLRARRSRASRRSDFRPVRDEEWRFTNVAPIAPASSGSRAAPGGLSPALARPRSASHVRRRAADRGWWS